MFHHIGQRLCGTYQNGEFCSDSRLPRVNWNTTVRETEGLGNCRISAQRNPRTRWRCKKNLSVQLPEPITADELEISGLHFNILLTPSVVVSGDKKGNEKLVPGASAATQLMPQLRTLADFPTIWEMFERKLQIVHACISSRWASLRCGGRLARRYPGSGREEHALPRHRTS